MAWRLNPVTGLWDFASAPISGERLTSTGNRLTLITENRYARGRNGSPSSTANPGLGRIRPHKPRQIATEKRWNSGTQGTHFGKPRP